MYIYIYRHFKQYKISKVLHICAILVFSHVFALFCFFLPLCIFRFAF